VPPDALQERNSVLEDLAKNLIIALSSITCCVLYCTPTSKRAFRRWISYAAGDPVFATMLIMTGIWIIHSLVSLPHQLSLLGADFVLFEDALGVPVRVPFSTCEHFEIFSAFLKVHFQGKPGFSHVLRRRYHLMIGDSRGRVIEYRNWKNVVRPHTKVSMAMLMTSHTTTCAKCGLSLDARDHNEFYW